METEVYRLPYMVQVAGSGAEQRPYEGTTVYSLFEVVEQVLRTNTLLNRDQTSFYVQVHGVLFFLNTQQPEAKIMAVLPDAVLTEEDAGELLPGILQVLSETLSPMAVAAQN